MARSSVYIREPFWYHDKENVNPELQPLEDTEGNRPPPPPAYVPIPGVDRFMNALRPR